MKVCISDSAAALRMRMEAEPGYTDRSFSATLAGPPTRMSCRVTGTKLDSFNRFPHFSIAY